MIRLAVRGLVMREGRLLVVNAYPEGGRELWCAPGGGAELHRSLPENLSREIHEETGLTVSVGEMRLINEFHDPEGTFHQVDIFFRCELVAGELTASWRDPEGVVHARRFVDRRELAALPHRPLTLGEAAWSEGGPIYDPLEPILR